MCGGLGSGKTNPHALGGSDSKSEPGHDEDPLNADRAPERGSRNRYPQSSPKVR
jgi:hypothetical protein